MRAVDELFQPLLGDQQHLIEQEESSFLLHSVDLEGTLQNELPKPTEVRPAPVHQQGLDFLQSDERSQTLNREKRKGCRTHTIKIFIHFIPPTTYYTPWTTIG